MQQSSLSSGLLWRVWRCCWLLAAAAILADGVAIRYALPRWPLIGADSCLYMLPSFNGGIYTIGPRMFVYPMFCRAVLQLTGDLRGLTIVQQLLGLIGPIMLLATWTALGAQLWMSRLARGAHELAGLAIFLLLLPSTPYVMYELQIMIESPNAFLQCCLAALLCFLWLPLLPKRRMLLACATSGFGIVMYYGNPRSGAATPVIVALAAIAAVIGRDPGRRWFRALWPVLATAAAVYGALGFVQARTTVGDAWNDTFTAKHLLLMHADLAVNEFRRDLAAPTPPPHAELLRKIIPKIQREIVGYGTSHWINLTFNSNALMYIPNNVDADIIAAFPNDPAGYRQFCLHYYFCIVRHQPFAYFRGVWRMLAYYYAAPQYDGSFREFPVGLSDSLHTSAYLARYVAQSALPNQRKELEKAATKIDGAASSNAVFWPQAWFWAIVRLIGRCFLSVTLGGVICAGFILSRSRLRAHAVLAVLAGLCLSSVAVLFAQELTLAMVTVTDGRYSDAMRTLAVFSFVCASVTIVSLVAKGAQLRFSPARGAVEQNPA